MVPRCCTCALTCVSCQTIAMENLFPFCVQICSGWQSSPLKTTQRKCVRLLTHDEGQSKSETCVSMSLRGHDKQSSKGEGGGEGEWPDRRSNSVGWRNRLALYLGWLAKNTFTLIRINFARKRAQVFRSTKANYFVWSGQLFFLYFRVSLAPNASLKKISYFKTCVYLRQQSNR